MRQFIKDKAEQFGAKTDNEFNKPYVELNNTGHEGLKDNVAYFEFIQPEEEASRPFLCFAIPKAIGSRLRNNLPIIVYFLKP